MRVFLALGVSDAVAQALRELQGQMRATDADVAWVRPEGLHLTLKFLGEVEPQMLPEIHAAVATVALRHAPMALHVESIGGFPNLRRPRVLWAGVQAAGIASLAQQLDDALSTVGFAAARETFHPHITLGRVRSFKRWDTLEAILSTHAAHHFGTCEAPHIGIFQSTLQAGGSVYSLLYEAPLTGSTG